MVHCSAMVCQASRSKPDMAAAVRSAAMMLDFLGDTDAAARIAKAVEDPSQFTGTTAEIGDAISERV